MDTSIKISEVIQKLIKEIEKLEKDFSENFSMDFLNPASLP